jgi:hypothetical protein
VREKANIECVRVPSERQQFKSMKLRKQLTLESNKRTSERERERVNMLKYFANVAKRAFGLRERERERDDVEGGRSGRR